MGTPTYDTTQEQIDYYANLLPKEYVTLPNAYATIQALAEMALMPQGGNYLTDRNGNALTDVPGNLFIDGPFIEPILPLALSEAFELPNAEGVQLEILAQAVGVQRSGFNLLGQYITLSDAQFRLLIQAASARNFLRATTQAIQAFIFQFFSGILQVVDDQRMHMTFFYLIQKGSLPWVDLFITGGLLPRPLGVGISIVYLYPYPSTNFFGVRTTIAPAPSYVSQISTVTVPLTGRVLTTSDGITI